MGIKDVLLVIVGFALQIALAYFPFIRDWYNKLDDAYKRLVTLGIAAAVAAILYALACANWLGAIWPGAPIACDVPTLIALLQALLDIAIGALLTNEFLVKPAQRISALRAAAKKK